MKKVIIMRGVPGSGKSTYIKNNFPDAIVCSADKFFEQNGEYKFNRELLGEAHHWCLRTFCSHLLQCANLVVVDNTNISTWEIAPYAQMALAHVYGLEIITLKVNPEVAHSRNVHGVPANVCRRGAGRLDRQAKGFPKVWKHTMVEQ